jgi:transporter family protein
VVSAPWLACCSYHLSWSRRGFRCHEWGYCSLAIIPMGFFLISNISINPDGLRSSVLSDIEARNTMSSIQDWFYWALLSAVFAAFTAIFAKIGLEDIDSDYATLIRTVVIVAVLTGFVSFAGKWSNPFTLSPKTLSFLALSGLATGASWVCYFRALKAGEASQVAPVDKLSLILVAILAFVFLGERPNAREWLGILMVGAGVIVLGFKR